MHKATAILSLTLLVSGCQAPKAKSAPPTFAERCHNMIHATCSHLDRCSDDGEAPYASCLAFIFRAGDPCDKMMMIRGPLEQCLHELESVPCKAGMPAICSEVQVQ